MAKRERTAGRELPVTQDGVEERLIERVLLDLDAAPDVVGALKAISFEPVTFFPLLTEVEWEAQVSASIGYDRTETHTEYDRHFERTDGGQLQNKPIPRTVTKTVTDWRPFAQFMRGSVTLDLPASKVSNQIDKALHQFARAGMYLESEIPQFAKVVQPDPTAELLTRYEHALSAAITSQIRADLPGDRKRDIRYSPTCESQISFMPIWQGIISYAGSKLRVVASALNDADLLFDAPKDTELVSLRATRKRNTIVRLGVGLLAAACVLAAAPSARTLIGDSAPTSVAVLVLATAVAASVLFSWPFVDRPLTLKIRERVASNVRQLSAATGIADDAVLQLREKSRKSDGERRAAHVFVWVAAAGIVLYGLYFVFLTALASD